MIDHKSAIPEKLKNQNALVYSHLRGTVTGEPIVVFFLEMNGELGLFADGGLGEAVQTGNHHLPLGLGVVDIINFVLGDDEGARLRPVVLVDLGDLLAHN